MKNLIGKTALVTGGSRGIGRAAALALAEAEPQFLSTTAPASKTPKMSLPKFRDLAATPSSSRVTSPRLTGLTVWPRKSAGSSVNVWTSLWPTRGFPGLDRSPRRRFRSSTTFSP